jgi:hypothetical protein
MTKQYTSGEEFMRELAVEFKGEVVDPIPQDLARDFMLECPVLVAKLKELQWEATESGRTEDVKRIGYVLGAIEKVSQQWWKGE